MNVETQETITFVEFRSWLAGLIRGKKGALPDLDDWRVIKEMIDKVIPEERVITIPTIPVPPQRDEHPWTPQSPWVQPNTGQPPYTPPVIWCSGSTAVAESGADKVELQVTNQNMDAIIESDIVDDGLQAAFAMMFSGNYEDK